MDATGTARERPVRAGLLTAHLGRAGGGVFTSVRQFARVLNAQPGLAIEVFGPAEREMDSAEWMPLKPHPAHTVGPQFFSYAPALTRQLSLADLDLVHLHGLWMHPSIASHAFTRRTGRPHMVSPHGMLDPWALRNSGWKKRLAASLFEKANLAAAACLHALNAAEAEAIRNYGFAGPVCVIPNGVELPAPGDPPPPLPWWTKNAPEKKTLLYLGRLHPKKGLPNLLTAWSRLDGELRDRWRLVIAGWDQSGHQSALRRMTTALRIETTVTFPGPLFGKDKKAAFHHCDGFILPSLSEGLPMVLLEAWACGKPVLMTPQCNLPEGFEAGAAVRIEPEAESLTEGLTRLLAMDAPERERMGENGRDLAARRFSWEVIGREMAEVYRWIARKGAKPGSMISTSP
jgi:poly(glycerol-phosphate) alpha-glucosyltransferase